MHSPSGRLRTNCRAWSHSNLWIEITHMRESTGYRGGKACRKYQTSGQRGEEHYQPSLEESPQEHVPQEPRFFSHGASQLLQGTARGLRARRLLALEELPQSTFLVPLTCNKCRRGIHWILQFMSTPTPAFTHDVKSTGHVVYHADGLHQRHAMSWSSASI